MELGSLTLTTSDIAGLDSLMDFYRSKHDSSCTTVDRLSLTEQRDGRLIATEQITDGSCQIYGMTGLTRFPDLIGRLNPQKQ